MHDELHYGAALLTIEVEAYGSTLSLRLIHEVALIVVVEDEALALREAEHGLCFTHQVHMLMNVAALSVNNLVVLLVGKVDQFSVPIHLVRQLLECDQLRGPHLLKPQSLHLKELQRLVLQDQANLIHHERALLGRVARGAAHLERVHGEVDAKAVYRLARLDVLDGAQVGARDNVDHALNEQCYDHAAREEHDLVDLALSSLTAVEQLELGLAAAEAVGPSANGLIVREYVATLVAEHHDVVTGVDGRNLLLFDIESCSQLVERAIDGTCCLSTCFHG